MDKMIGKKFGRLTVATLYDKRTKWRQKQYICKCDCGSKSVVIGGDIRRGRTKSCGCLKIEKLTKHGHNTRSKGESPTYISWKAMKSRCINKNNNMYKYYGEKGVKVHPKWIGEDGFANFRKDMGDCPETPEGEPRLTLSRHKDNGNYEPGNCKWATLEEQLMQKKDMVWIKHNGKDYTMREFCELENVDRQAFRYRFRALGMTVEESLDDVRKNYKPRSKEKVD